MVAAQDRRIDVHVDEWAGRLEPVAPRPDLGEAATDGQGEVAGGGELARERRRGAAETGPEPEGVALGEDALPLYRRRHRGLEPLGQGDQLGAGAGGAQAEVEQRALALRQKRPHALDRLGGRLGRGRCRRRPGFDRRLVPEQVVVGRDLDEHGSRRGGTGELAGPAHGRVDLRAVGRTQLRLGDGPDHPRLIDIVELIRFPGVGADPAAEHQQRDPIEKSLGDPRGGVGKPGAGHQVGAAQRPRRSGDGVGHERGGLLIRDQDRAHAGRAAQRVVKLDVVRAGDAEGEGNALVLEGAHYDLSSGQLRHVEPRDVGKPGINRAALLRPAGYVEPPGRPEP